MALLLINDNTRWCWWIIITCCPGLGDSGVNFRCAYLGFVCTTNFTTTTTITSTIQKNAKLFVVDNVVLLYDATKTSTACPSSADSESSSHDSSCPEGLMLHYLCTIWLCARCLFTDFMSPLCYITHKHTSSVYLLNFALTIMWQSLQETKQY